MGKYPDENLILGEYTLEEALDIYGGIVFTYDGEEFEVDYTDDGKRQIFSRDQLRVICVFENDEEMLNSSVLGVPFKEFLKPENILGMG